MKPKFVFLCILVLLSILFHYTLKNSIVNYSRENLIIESELNSERAINKDLKSEYNDLQAYSRIVHKATTELGMFISPSNSDHVHVVHNSLVRNKRVFTIIDFISPTADAMVRR